MLPQVLISQNGKFWWVSLIVQFVNCLSGFPNGDKFEVWGLASTTSLLAQMIKNMPAIQDTQVWSLDQEDPLEKEMVTYSSILAWRILWTEDPVRLQSIGLRRVRHNWESNTFTFYHSCFSIVWERHCQSLTKSHYFGAQKLS